MTTGEPFNRGHISGTVTGTAYPDYYEVYQLINGNSDINYLSNESDIKTNTEAIQSRRVLYYAMTKVAGLFVNPQEIWHYGKGDPLSEYVSGSNHPYYGIADLPQWYLDKLSEMTDE